MTAPDHSHRRRSGRRLLTREELELWREVTRTVTPRPGASLAIEPTPAPAKALVAKVATPPAYIVPDYSPAPRPKPALAPLTGIERRLKQKLARGRTGVDEALDLHGMRQQEAHHALRGFLHAAHGRGARLVVIVTGKGGRPGPDDFAETGVLRRNVPHWLHEADLRPIVLGFEEAAPLHGGSGALYVRLRRRV